MSRASRLLRMLLLALVMAALGGVATVAVRHRQPKATPVTLGTEHDGWTIRGVRRSHYEGGSRVLTLSVDRARLEHVGLGPIGLGFARRVVAHDASIDVVVNPSAADPVAALRRALAALDPRMEGAAKRSRPNVTGARIERVRLHASRADADAWMEITADRVESELLDRERLRLLGNVRVRDARTEITFDRLIYDAGRMRFVSAKGGRVVTAPVTASADGALDLVNRVVADLVRKPASPIL